MKMAHFYKNLLFFFCLFSFLKLIPADSEGEEDVVEMHSGESVLTLTSDNFTEVVSDKGIILVEFYAPWCGHCKQLAPEYEAAAQQLLENDPPIPLAKVDATSNEELAMKYEVEGYPTLKVFRDGTPYDYEGPRKADGIVQYMLNEARPDWEPPKDRVVVLTNENFTETIESNDLVLVEFYAPWCGHCKRLAPQYEKAARTIYDMGSDIVLAKVDATVEQDLGTQYQVTGYPTLKLFRRGRVSEYNGPRDSNGIIKYMMKQSEPATLPLTSIRDITRNLRFTSSVLVGFFESPDDPGFLAYSDAANEARESSMIFAHTADHEIASTYNIEFGTIAIFIPRRYYNEYEPKIKEYKGPYDVPPSELIATLKRLSTPLVGWRTQGNADLLYSVYPLFVGYMSIDDEEDSFEYLKNKMIPLTIKYPEIVFAISDDSEFKNELKELQLDDRSDDFYFAIFAGLKEKYAFDKEEITTETMEEFILDYKAGNLRPVRRSQPIPKKNSGPVTVVVADTFTEIVENPDKDVLIEFYAPWCGHCKALEPIYKSLAKKYKKNDNLVIAKFDATANDAPEHYQFSGFPTIFFVPAGEESSPILYEDKRELKEMVAFLKEHATHSLETKKSSKKPKEEL